ncbi:MAG: manganese efflux pump [Clostridia bacterium]
MLTIFLTGILVNIDAMFGGIALGISNKPKFTHLLVCASVGFFMCLFACLVGEGLEAIAGERMQVLAGIILVLIGIRNIILFVKQKLSVEKRTNGIVSFLAVGFSVGLDAMAGAFSLSLIVSETYLIPIVFGLAQFLFTWLGMVVTNLKFFSFLKKASYLSGVFLIVIGLIRFF